MINLSTAHYFSFGADPSVTIAVLDTGVAYLNTGDRTMAPDLEGTIVYQGYDFVSDDGIAVDEGDGNIGHGTFLAGVVAQTTFNSHGSAGIAFNASILPVRVANRRGVAKAGDLARGIRYAVAGGASIILVGIAGPSDSRAVREAIELANRLNVAVIAPAGNSQEVRFPARYSQVLSVGAVDAAGKPAYYSPEEGPIDIYAPGGDIRNGVDSNDDGYPDGIIAESFRGRDFNSYEAIMLEGTSAAAAHVAGVAALLMSNEGVMTPDSLYRALRSGARILDGLPVLDAGKTLLRSNRLTR
jgi:serine protease